MRRRITWINAGLGLLLIAALALGFVWLFRPTAAASTSRTVPVQTGDVQETVTATGTVSSAGTVELSFGAAGEISDLKVAAGDDVKAGQVLARVDDTQATQTLANAKRTYAQAVTSADQSGLSLGAAADAVTTATDAAAVNRRGYDDAVATAQAALSDARNSWATTCLDPAGACPNSDAWAQLRSAEGEVESAKRAYTQAVATASADETTNNLKVNQAAVNVATAQAKATADCAAGPSSQCTSAQSAVTSAQQSYDNTVNAQKVAALQSQQSLQNADARITSANVALKKLQASLPQQSAEAIEAAERSVESAKLARTKGVAADTQSVEKAQQSLASLRAAAASVDTGAGTTTADAAALEVARAGVEAAQDALEATVIRAPVDGSIGAVALEEGDPAAAGASVLTIVADAAYEVDAAFSEADALKVKAGQPATVTFEALSGQSATGTVSSIDLVATTGENVTTYSATITLANAPADLRDGMTASVVVTVDEATGVLWAPSAAVTTAGGVSTVTVRRDGVDSVVPVTTGLVGDAGTEITSGVAAGDDLVIVTATGDGGNGFPSGGIPLGAFRGGGGGGPQVVVTRP